jgi:hypothetical protein
LAALIRSAIFFSIFKSQLVAGVILIKVWRSVGRGLSVETPWGPSQGQQYVHIFLITLLPLLAQFDVCLGIAGGFRGSPLSFVV